MLGEHVEPHLAARGEDVDGVVLVSGQQNAVAAGRLAEPVDLFAQRQQLLAGFLEGLHQLGVARRQRVDSRLELVHVARTARGTRRADGVLQLFTQNRGLASELFQLGGILVGEVWFARASERFTLKLTHGALLSRSGTVVRLIRQRYRRFPIHAGTRNGAHWHQR